MTKISREDNSSRSSGDESNDLPIPKNFASNKVQKKSSPNGSKMETVSQDEMQSLLAKLKELVPNIPRNKKVSKLEIIQYVIDYIFDLQVALETHPTSLSQPSIAKSANNSASLSPSNRQPLAIKWVS